MCTACCRGSTASKSRREAAATLQRLWALAEAHTPAQRVGDYTQAIMDLGATLCTRHQPGCVRCPLARRCEAHRAGIASELPRSRTRATRPQRATVVLLVRHGPDRAARAAPAHGYLGRAVGLARD